MIQEIGSFLCSSIKNNVEKTPELSHTILVSTCGD